MGDEWERNANPTQPGHDDHWPLSTTPIRTPVFRRRSEVQTQSLPPQQPPLPPTSAQQPPPPPQRQHRRPSYSYNSQQYHSPYYWGAHYSMRGRGEYRVLNASSSQHHQTPHQQQRRRSYSPTSHRRYSSVPRQSHQGPPPPQIYREYSYPYPYSPDPIVTSQAQSSFHQSHHVYGPFNPELPQSYPQYGPRQQSPPPPQTHTYPLQQPVSSSAYHPGAPDAFTPPHYDFDPPRLRVSYDIPTPSPPDAVVEVPPMMGQPQPFPPQQHVPPEYVYFSDNAASAAEEGHDGDLVYQIEENDVLCGRGAPTTYHPGNQFFKDLITKYQPTYVASRRSDKPQIATQIVKIVRERGGRFLRRTKQSGLGPSGHFAWEDIGDQRAYEKACQALRENAPEIRRRLQSQELAAISIDSEQPDAAAAPPRVSDESSQKKRSPRERSSNESDIRFNDDVKPKSRKRKKSDPKSKA